jgi:hypothetical protein
MLWNKDDLGMTLRYEASAKAAQSLGVIVQPLGVREPNDFDEAFAAMARALQVCHQRQDRESARPRNPAERHRTC